jgi:hypothetical protein
MTSTTTTTAKRPRFVRVALQDVVVDGGPVRLGSVLTYALAVNLRKLDGVVVACMAEVRALIEQEGAHQLVGCADESCLAEIADALGADVVFSVSVARLGQENVVAARTIDSATGQAKTTSHRVAAAPARRCSRSSAPSSRESSALSAQ